MIEVAVPDVLVWIPQDWQPQPAAEEKKYPEMPRSKRHVVLLKERDGERVLPMWIGPHEADALVLHLAEVHFLRPLTHDFIARLLDAAEVKIERVAVSALREDTFIATVTIRSGQQSRDVDARPSDAINLAVRAGLPIFVAPEVMAREDCVFVGDVSSGLMGMAARRGETLEAGYAWRSGRDIVLAQKDAGK
jgi:bifunctional DNase/RNase